MKQTANSRVSSVSGAVSSEEREETPYYVWTRPLSLTWELLRGIQETQRRLKDPGQDKLYGKSIDGKRLGWTEVRMKVWLSGVWWRWSYTGHPAKKWLQSPENSKISISKKKLQSEMSVSQDMAWRTITHWQTSDRLETAMPSAFLVDDDMEETVEMFSRLPRWWTTNIKYKNWKMLMWNVE